MAPFDGATEALLTNLVLQGALGTIVYLLYERNRKNLPVFEPRLRTRPNRVPEELPRGLLAWVRPVLAVGDDEARRMMGLDAFMLVSFLRTLTKAAALATLGGLVVLLPVYQTGVADIGGFAKTTMAHVVPQGDRYWASLIMFYIFTVATTYLLGDLYRRFFDWRQEFLRNGDPDDLAQQNYTVIVERIPEQYRSSAALRAFFESMFPGEVHSANVMVNAGALEKLVPKRLKTVSALEKSIASEKATGEEVIIHKKGMLCCKSEPVRATEHHAHQLTEENERIRELQALARNPAAIHPAPVPGERSDEEAAMVEEAKHDEPAPSGTGNYCTTGFVTFTTKVAAAAAYQMMLADDALFMVVKPAPAPAGMVWKNASRSLDTQEKARSTTNTIFGAGVLFWGLVLAFVGAISNLDTLESLLPFISLLRSIPVVYGLIAGVLPVVLVLVFIGLLPTFFSIAATSVEGLKSAAEVQTFVLGWFFAYTLANVAITVISGSLFSALSDAIDRPQSIIILLAQSLPRVAAYFMNLVITATLFGMPMALLRVGPWLTTLVFRKFLNEDKLTRRALREGPYAPPSVNYGVVYGKHILFTFVLCVYWVIAPLVSPTVMCYFAAAFVITKYQCLYVNVPKFESGGSFWFAVYNQAMACLLTATTVNVAFLAISQAAIQAPLSFPLPFFVFYHWRSTHRKYYDASQNVTRRRAHMDDEADAAGAAAGEGAVADKFSDEAYMQPVLIAPALEPEPYRTDPDGRLFSLEGWLLDGEPMADKVADLGDKAADKAEA